MEEYNSKIDKLYQDLNDEIQLLEKLLSNNL